MRLWAAIVVGFVCGPYPHPENIDFKKCALRNDKSTKALPRALMTDQTKFKQSENNAYPRSATDFPPVTTRRASQMDQRVYVMML